MVTMSGVGGCEGERLHHPRDIEATAEQASLALRPGYCAAFTTLVGERELLVLAQEISRQAWPVDVAEVADAIRTAVAAEHRVQVYAVILLPPHGLPTPPSGTTQRDLCAEMYVRGQLPELSRSVLDDPSPSRNEVTREPWREVASSIPHGRTSRWYRWVGGSRSSSANVLDREFMFPHVVAAPPQLAG